jgi:hypothetical protein
MKFCRPIFKSVSEVDSALAKEVFSKSSSAFHPIARRLIEKVGLVLMFCGLGAHICPRILVCHE